MTSLPYEIIEIIISFVSDNDFIQSLKPLSQRSDHAEPILDSTTIQRMVSFRKGLICKDGDDLNLLSFLFDLNQNGKIEKHLIVEGKDEFLSENDLLMIQQFSHVMLVNVVFNSELFSLFLDPTKCKIKHLVFNSCSKIGNNRINLLQISPTVKSIDFRGNNRSLLDYLDNVLFTSQVEKLCFDNFSTIIETILQKSHFTNLKKLVFNYESNAGTQNSIPRSVHTIHVNNPNHFQLFPSQLRKMILRYPPLYQTYGCEEIVVREKGKTGNVSLMRALISLKYHTITIPESFFHLSPTSLSSLVHGNRKKTIKVMIDRKTPSILHKILKIRLKSVYPGMDISFEENENDLMVKCPSKIFETIHFTRPRLISLLEMIYKKLKSIKRQQLVYPNQLNSLKTKFSEMVHDSERKFAYIDLLIFCNNELDQIDNFRTMVQIHLENIDRAIIKYEKVCGFDSFISKHKQFRDDTLKKLKSVKTISFEEPFNFLQFGLKEIKSRMEEFYRRETTPISQEEILEETHCGEIMEDDEFVVECESDIDEDDLANLSEENELD